MILILLASILSATAHPDYYAVRMKSENKNYKIFTKIRQCSLAVYQRENRVLFHQDLYWRIGRLKNNERLDCKNISSVLVELYRTKGGQIPKDNLWIDMKNGTNNSITIPIWIEGLNTDVPVPGFKLVGVTKKDAESQEDCFGKDWGEEYPDKDIVVAFLNTKCSFVNVEEAKLKQNQSAVIFIHPSGKNKRKGNDS